MNLKAFLTMPLSFLMMLFSLLLPARSEGIAVIHVSQRSAGFSREYKIDLARKNLWEHAFYIGNGDIPRNESAPFEGYRFAGRLNSTNIKAFLEAARAYGFAEWDAQYDGYQNSPGGLAPPGSGTELITIIFSDGTTKTTLCSGAFPGTYNEMRAAFQALTGMDVL